ncbi:MAG: HEPN domain-containing protein [Candidatus Poribacteria bacterium]|nr:HEPN domain-containing protein [Candidatus Poribacteria bacterium]
MITRQDIQAACDDIVREFAPLQVILFGSYAYGTPTESSDVDLLVVMPTPKSERHHRVVEVSQRIPRRFNIDLLVRSPEEVAYRLSHNDWFLREITEKGEVLYEANNFLLETPKKEKGDMNPLTLEWIEKAESDYTIALLIQKEVLLIQDEQNPIYDGICFHAQQCIEKYLKAWLQEADIPIPRTHDLKELLELIVPTVPMWRTWEPDFSVLSRHAVAIRYPGNSATTDTASHAMHICNAVRQAVRAQLKLSPDVK